MSTVIRPAAANQADILSELEQQTFTETFSHQYHPDDLASFLQETKSAYALKQILSQPDTLYFIAWQDEQPAGFLKLNLHKQPDDEEHSLLPTPVMELEKIYVLQSSQGKQVGKALMQQVYKVARQHHVKSIWLGVWEHNTKALNFYLKEGFQKFSSHLYRVGHQVDTDWLLKKIMSEGENDRRSEYPGRKPSL